MPKNTVEIKIQKKHFAEYGYWAGNRDYRKTSENVIEPRDICGYSSGLMTSNTYYAKWLFDSKETLTDIIVKSRGDGP